MHVFEPSGRQVWTVVGKTGEHWVDKETGFCSCSAYFFDRIRGGKGCYHVESVHMSGTNVQIAKFPDSQYGTFLAELVERISVTALL